MKIKLDETNGKIINSKSVYIHDDILQDIHFDREKKKLILSILKEGTEKKEYTIEYIQVIGFTMTSCDYWGASPYIFDFEYVEKEERSLIPELFKVKNSSDTPYCTLDESGTYMETVITFTSGDKLKVACKSILMDMPEKTFR